MSDLDLPVTRKDVSVSITVDGVLWRVVDMITSITEEAAYTDTEHKPLGTSKVYHDAQHEGWSGTIEFGVSRSTLDDMVDVIHQAQRNRVPTLINIKVQTKYRNGTSKTYLYPDCKLGFSRSASGDGAATVSMPWRTGNDRIAL